MFGYYDKWSLTKEMYKQSQQRLQEKKNKLEVKVYFSTSEALYALIGDLIHYILLLFEVKK